LSTFLGDVAILALHERSAGRNVTTSVETLVLILGGVTAGWALLSFFVMRRSRHRRQEIAFFQGEPRRRERPVRMREEAGAFVPLAEAFVEEPEPEPEPEPVPEPEEPELEPVDYAPPPTGLETASLYEVVWYRDGDADRIAFALQPVDGRAASWARYRSTSFSWGEDRDPPATLRAAQSAHGRLRARLERDGWTASGREGSWFNHRFQPPATAPGRASSAAEN
jgi:hypothetical protein